MSISSILSIWAQNPENQRRIARLAALNGSSTHVPYLEIVKGQGFFDSDSEQTRKAKMAKLGFPFMAKGSEDTVIALADSDRELSRWTYRGREFYFSDETDAVFFRLL